MEVTSALALFRIHGNYDRDNLEEVYRLERDVATSRLKRGRTLKEKEVWGRKLKKLELAYYVLLEQLSLEHRSTVAYIKPAEELGYTRRRCVDSATTDVPLAVAVAVTCLSAALFVATAYWERHRGIAGLDSTSVQPNNEQTLFVTDRLERSGTELSSSVASPSPLQ